MLLFVEKLREGYQLKWADVSTEGVVTFREVQDVPFLDRLEEEAFVFGSLLFVFVANAMEDVDVDVGDSFREWLELKWPLLFFQQFFQFLRFQLCFFFNLFNLFESKIKTSS